MITFASDGTQPALLACGGIYVMQPDSSDLRRVNPEDDHGELVWLPERY